MSMTPWQERIVEEKRELDERIKKLREFMATPAYAALPIEDASLLLQQRGAMNDYSRNLGLRIARFPNGGTV